MTEPTGLTAARAAPDHALALAPHPPAPGVGTLRFAPAIGVVDADANALDLLGLPPARVYAHGWLDAVHPDDRVVAEGALADLFSHARPCDLECRVVGPAVERWVRIRAVPLRDGETSDMTTASASVVDITRERAARDELARMMPLAARARDAEAGRHRSDAALRAIVQASPLAVVVLDDRGVVHVWNDAAERLFGWRADEAVGRAPRFVVDASTFDALVTRALAGGAVSEPEVMLRSADGTNVVASVAMAPLPGPTGRVRAAVAVIADVTEHKRAERRFRTLVQHASDMVLLLDEDGTVGYASPSACEFLGCVPEDLAGKRPPELVDAADEAAVRLLFDRLRANPASTETLTFRVNRGEATHWVEMVATNLLDDPDVRGIVTTTRDITDRFEAEAAIRASEERLRALVASASDVISVLERDGRVRYTSPVSYTLLGYTPDDHRGRNLFALVHPDDRERVTELLATAGAAERPVRPVEVRLQRADGSWMYAEIVANDLLDDPAVRGIVVTTRDVTERREAELALRESEARVRERDARYRAVLDDQTELVCRYLPDTRLTFVNRAFAEFYDRDADELVGTPLTELFSSIERIPAMERLRGLGPGNEVQTQELREVAADGSVRWYQWTDRAFLDADGEVVELQSVGRDVTERRRAEVLTVHQAEILEGVARGVPLDQTLRTIARIVEEHFGHLRCAVMQADPVAGTLHVAAAPSLPTRLVELIDGVVIESGSVPSAAAARDRRAVHVPDLARETRWDEYREVALAAECAAVSSGPVLGSDGQTVLGTLDVYSRTAGPPDSEQRQIVSLLAHLASIAIERKAFEERLAHQSMHDPLTGLPNRFLFLDRLALAIARCRRTGSEVAVLFLDLDRFKNVNDSVGHDAGDELLVAAARRLESLLRPGDTVARFGGDEFTVLCEDLPAATARDGALDIAQRLLAVLGQPFIVRGTETFVGASIGLALATGEERPEELLRDADAAMYAAKESGRGRVAVFDSTMRARALARHATENALHRAIERGELRLFFQPVISLREARCTGAEALVRWQHPERGLLAPGDFVPLAEETGLVLALGEWVLEHAAREAARWQLERDDPFLVSVNLSARQLAQPGFPELLAEVVARTGADPQHLCLEITESVLMDDARTALRAIERVRDTGVHLHIDDFGTGYSSLGYLKRLPVDGVKIDRSFVHGLGSDSGDGAIVSAVIGLAHALGLEVVAEGVETQDQLVALVDLGCDQAQGYYFAPPQPAADLRRVIGNHRTWRPPGSRIMGLRR